MSTQVEHLRGRCRCGGKLPGFGVKDGLPAAVDLSLDSASIRRGEFALFTGADFCHLSNSGSLGIRKDNVEIAQLDRGHGTAGKRLEIIRHRHRPIGENAFDMRRDKLLEAREILLAGGFPDRFPLGDNVILLRCALGMTERDDQKDNREAEELSHREESGGQRQQENWRARQGVPRREGCYAGRPALLE